MNRKKIESFIKEYFYFTQSERKGIFGLIFILIIVLALPALYSFVFPPKPLDFSIEDLEDLSIHPNKENPTGSYKGNNFFNFNPNTASDNDLKQLGFTDKNISTIRNYLSKGGSFKKPDDLSKMYGLKKDLAETLIPYVLIPQYNTLAASDSINIKVGKQKSPLEINGADTNQLIALYRIGPGLARRIVEYRNKLGGFLSLNQLTEIFGFDPDILYDLDGKIYVDSSKAKKLDVNTVTADELKLHPYFKFKLSNAIVNYRLQHGVYKQLSDLKNIVIVNDSIYNNIIKYLIIK